MACGGVPEYDIMSKTTPMLAWGGNLRSGDRPHGADRRHDIMNVHLNVTDEAA